MRVPRAEPDHEHCARQDAKPLRGDSEGDRLRGVHTGRDQHRGSGTGLGRSSGWSDRQRGRNRGGAEEAERHREIGAKTKRGQQDEDGERT